MVTFQSLFALKNDDVVKELCWKTKSQLWCRCNLPIMPKAIQHVMAQSLNYWLWNSKTHWQYQFSNFKVNFENNIFEQICILTTSLDIREAFWFQIEHLTKRLKCDQLFHLTRIAPKPKRTLVGNCFFAHFNEFHA